MSPCGLVTEPGVYKYDGAVECRGAHDKNVFNRKEIFIFQSTFLAVIQSWPVRPLVVISKPRTRHQAGPSQQPQARLLKVSTKIRGNFHNISEASLYWIWNTSFKDLCCQNPCFGFVDKRSHFRLRDCLNTSRQQCFNRFLSTSGHFQQKEGGSRCFPLILCSTKFRGHL